MYINSLNAESQIIIPHYSWFQFHFVLSWHHHHHHMSHSTISPTFLSAFIFFNMGRFWYFFQVSPYYMYLNLLISLLFRHITKIIIKVNSIFYPKNGQSTMSQYQGMHVFIQKKATNNHKEFIFLVYYHLMMLKFV